MAAPAVFSSSKAEHDYIVARATQLGLDPEAVLAVAAHEGVTLPAEVGDSGTSFGPWQLHHGGALPEQIWSQGPEYAQMWANSQAGIDYALGQIAGVARGLRGPAAINAIVYGFEHPASPAPEVAAAVATYQQGGGPSSPSFGQIASMPGAHSTGPSLRDIPVVGGDVKAAANAISSVGDLIKFVTSWRFAEIVGGFLLLLVGLVLLARALGMGTPPVPGVGAIAARTDPLEGLQRQETARRRRVQRQGFEPQSQERDRREARARRGAPGSSRLAAGDSIPY